MRERKTARNAFGTEARLPPVAVGYCLSGILLLFAVLALNGMVD